MKILRFALLSLILSACVGEAPPPAAPRVVHGGVFVSGGGGGGVSVSGTGLVTATGGVVDPAALAFPLPVAKGGSGLAAVSPFFSPVATAQGNASSWGAGDYTAGLAFRVAQASVSCTGMRAWLKYGNTTKNLKFSIWDTSGTRLLGETETAVADGASGSVHVHTWATPQTLTPNTSVYRVSVRETGGTLYAYANTPATTFPLTGPLLYFASGDKIVTANSFGFGAGDTVPSGGGYTFATGEFYAVEPVFQ